MVVKSTKRRPRSVDRGAEFDVRRSLGCGSADCLQLLADLATIALNVADDDELDCGPTHLHDLEFPLGREFGAVIVIAQ